MLHRITPVTHAPTIATRVFRKIEFETLKFQVRDGFRDSARFRKMGAVVRAYIKKDGEFGLERELEVDSKIGAIDVDAKG